ncbi:MAG: hypothetical protein GW778_08930 [Alphaproteobacteria bacterium]|nr:hypothetical protein [Alphaproteobacteria bacterium]
MFTSIGNILGVKPRHAEQNDTRQDIQRHDPEFERRRKKKQKAEEELFGQEDGATLSIDALSVFLNKFLKELSDKQPSKGFNATSSGQSENKTEQADSPSAERPVSGKAAQAAGAYQHMAQRQHETSILGEVNENNADLISLDAAEIRTIHAILEDLKLLEDKDIEYIHIQRADSFLQSLVNAVNTVKSSKLFNT